MNHSDFKKLVDDIAGWEIYQELQVTKREEVEVEEWVDGYLVTDTHSIIHGEAIITSKRDNLVITYKEKFRYDPTDPETLDPIDSNDTLVYWNIDGPEIIDENGKKIDIEFLIDDLPGVFMNVGYNHPIFESEERASI